MTKVYIASPYTQGDSILNVRRSLAAADELLEQGFIPFVPLLSHFWHFYSPKPYDVWTLYDLEWVTACDALLRLAGESSGADCEVAEAQGCGIPVFYSMEQLIAELTPENATTGT